MPSDAVSWEADEQGKARESSCPFSTTFTRRSSKQRHWEGFHSKWAGAIVDNLNNELSPGYFAEPNIHLGALHQELCEVLQVTTGHGDETSDLYAIAYRTRGMANGSALEFWYHSLAIGQELPTLPTWISPVDAVPLDLAESYGAACRTLRIEF